MNLKRVFSRYDKCVNFKLSSHFKPVRKKNNVTRIVYACRYEKKNMKKALYLQLLIACSLALLVFNSCTKNDTNNRIVPDQSFVEEFDTVSAAVTRGWHL